MKQVQALAAKLSTDLEDLNSCERNPTQNIQSLWAQFKSDVTKYGKHCSRFITSESTRQIRTWKAQLTLVLHDDDMPLQDKSEAIYMLENKIRKCLEDEAERKKASASARYDVEGETLRTKSCRNLIRPLFSCSSYAVSVTCIIRTQRNSSILSCLCGLSLHTFVLLCQLFEHLPVTVFLLICLSVTDS
jgi:hypothetical protein